MIDITDTASAAQFRTQIKAWLDAACPASLRGADLYYAGGQKDPITNPDFQAWFEACVQRGFTVPTWPGRYGGAGLTTDQARILQEEMQRIGAPKPLAGMGTTMIGPTLLELGTEEQRVRHLPGISSGRIRWCQGYSEPGAGSDLASLATRAELDGDSYILNGSKIWTSGADLADWIFCLVRTDTQLPKHQGISFLLFSMDTPGITVKPIELVSGSSPFCEIFFTDVRASRRDLLGQENNGWSIAKRLLQYERNSVTEPGSGSGSGTLGGLVGVAREYLGPTQGKITDHNVRDAIIRNEMNSRTFDLTVERTRAENEAGGVVTFATSMFKYYSTELTCEEDEIRLQIMGTAGLGWEGKPFSDFELAMGRKWLGNKALKIAGGTNEVQLNIIGKRVLALPD